MNLCFKIILTLTIALISITLIPTVVFAQQTVGLFLNEIESFDGYTLFTKLASSDAYLMDNFGRVVHQWNSNGLIMGGSPILMDNGHLLWNERVISTTGGAHLIEYDWDGNIVWEWEDATLDYLHHHDMALLPNGNILILAREPITAAEAFAAGRDSLELASETLLPEIILEIKPTGPTTAEIVWEWRTWDHLVQDINPLKSNYGVIEEHPELIDINFGTDASDWLHANALDYNPDLDQIIISLRSFSEFWVIDHSTTPAESAGHTGGNQGRGGDILYRWGNPATYQSGGIAEQTLSKQHNVHWIPEGLPGAGNILIFNNGNDWSYSSIVEMIPPVDGSGSYNAPAVGNPYLPASAFWTYTDTPSEDMFAAFISGCQRLPNGNTLICVGPIGNFIEVTNEGQKVWMYRFPISNAGVANQGETISQNAVFRCTRFAKTFPGFDGQTLIPGGPIEIYPIAISSSSHFPLSPEGVDDIRITTQIDTSPGLSRTDLFVDVGNGYKLTDLLDDGLHDDGLAGDGVFGSSLISASDGAFVTYYLEVEDVITNLVSDPPDPNNVVYRLNVGYSCGNIDGVMVTGNPTNISDLTYLVDYLFRNGAPPVDFIAADLDGSQGSNPVNISDLTYLVDFLFRSGPAPNCIL